MPRRRVAFLIETSKAFGRGVLAGAGKYARLHGRWTTYIEERGLDDPVPDWLSAAELDGILLRSRRPAIIRKVLELDVPVVALGEENPPDATCVMNDDAACARLAADHLLQRGFQHYAYVGLKGYIWSDARRASFTDHLEQAGFDCDVLETAANTDRESSWYLRRDRIAKWIRSLPKPVGIMACYDAAARMLLDVCREETVMVPEQVAILGVDNDEVLCELCDPPLTSVAPDTEAIGAEAARLLDELISQGSTATQHVIVAPRNVVTRASTDTMAIDEPAVATALGIIRRNACDGLDVSDVLERVPLSRRTLERRFRTLLGHSPLSEIRQVRLRRVKELLVETDLKLDAIARMAGYSYTAYMVAQFREAEGVTPGQYRQKIASAST